MHRIQIIHWKPEELKGKIEPLRAEGYELAHKDFSWNVLRKLRDHPPSAVIIDLSRLPMQGRDVAVALRHYKTTRHVPIVFVEGLPEKIEKVKKQLPDAVYSTWPRAQSALKLAIAHSPKDPVVPPSLMGGYSGTPLIKKLGITEGATVVIVNGPKGFEKTLDGLPDDVTIRRQARGKPDLVLWFVRTRKDLEVRIDRMAAFLGEGALWIIWPKKTSRLASDLTQADVRKIGLASGLVDFKICAVDETWSGLKFTERKRKKKKGKRKR
ncbi:hypothetical protein ACFLU6_06660 [Acidobacteriota bacterium]